MERSSLVSESASDKASAASAAASDPATVASAASDTAARDTEVVSAVATTATSDPSDRPALTETTVVSAKEDTEATAKEDSEVTARESDSTVKLDYLLDRPTEFVESVILFHFNQTAPMRILK